MVEIAPFATDTLRSNFLNASVVGPPHSTGDVRAITGADLETAPDVLAGGPPCQSFSVAAAQRFLKHDGKFKRIGFRDELRGNLTYEYLRLLEELRPRVFVLENVPGMRDMDGGETLTSILEVARGLGYYVAPPQVLQAADYGVPQLRRRLIVLGSLDGTPRMPEPTHAPRGGLLMRPWTTTAQALANLPEAAPNHQARDHEAASIARYRKLRVSEREQLGRVDRLDPHRPSKTVIAGGANGGGRSHLHPLLARTLTVRECARLQTFPDDFVFSGTMSRQFTQVGNAVPPLLGEVLGRTIGQQFFGFQFADGPTLAVERRAPDPQAAIASLIASSRQSAGLWYEDMIDRSLELALKAG